METGAAADGTTTVAAEEDEKEDGEMAHREAARATRTSPYICNRTAHRDTARTTRTSLSRGNQRKHIKTWATAKTMALSTFSPRDTLTQSRPTQNGTSFMQQNKWLIKPEAVKSQPKESSGYRVMTTQSAVEIAAYAISYAEQRA